jgi:hypothetical protein
MIHLDTEQSRADHYGLIERALTRAKLTDPPDWFRSYCVTGFGVPDLRAGLGLLLRGAKESNLRVHSVLLDGVADFVGDVNDPAECNKFVSDLHALAIEYDCPIVCVIHFNPGTDKTRGHLGSQLERKAETNLRLDKDEETIVVWSDKNRRAPITKASGPRFRWSDAAGMHVSSETMGAAKAFSERKMMEHEAAAVFTQTRQTSLSWSAFLAGLRQAGGVKSDSGARKRMEKMLGAQVISKNLVGHYELTT